MTTGLSKRALALALAFASTLASSACEVPPVVASQDDFQNQVSARVEGHLVVQGTARGRVVITLFAAERPPPPEGTGRPLSFAVIPAEAVFGEQLHRDGTGPFTAPFTFSLVPAGRYVIRAFLDKDGCAPLSTDGCRGPDFLPWYSVTAEPNAGDVGGGAVDPVTRAFRTVSVVEGDDGVVLPATEVAVSIASTATLVTDRPSFQVSGTATFQPAGGNKVLELFPAPLSSGVIRQTAPAFLARYVDADNNGVPDDANLDGLPDLYPKIFVRKLADRVPPLLDENDLDRNGIIDATGADYDHAATPADGLPDAVVLAAGLDPTNVYPLLNDSGGAPRMDAIVPLPKLTLVIRPLALDVSAPVSQPLGAVPSGRYAITVVQFTGQTWRVPNELQPGIAPSLGLPSFDSQQFFLEVP